MTKTKVTKKDIAIWRYVAFGFCMWVGILSVCFSENISPDSNANLSQNTLNTKAISQESLASLLEEMSAINQEIAKSQATQNPNIQSLLKHKEVALQSFLSGIMDNAMPIGIDSTKNLKDQEVQEVLLIQSEITHDNLALALAKIHLYSLKLDENINNAIIALRKNIDFFSTKDKVLKIIKPYEDAINGFKHSFEEVNLSAESSARKASFHKENQAYSSKIATYIEVFGYISQHAQSILPQNMFLNISVEYILDKIAKILPTNHSNILISKIILSLCAFIVLWLCRRLIALGFIKCIDIAVRFVKHDRQIHSQIQKDIIKPISSILLFLSFDISLNILYYPSLTPPKFEVWFPIIYIVNFVWFLIIALKCYGIAFVSTLAKKSGGTLRKEVVNLILKIMYSIIIIIGGLMVLKTLGFNVSAIIASLGLGGLAVALAVKDMLANFFASVMLLFDNSFSQGDWIECGGIEGTIVEIGLRKTIIRTFDNGLVMIPNADLSNKSITNWSRRKEGRRIKMAIGLSYDTSVEQLQKCATEIKDMLLQNPKIAKDSESKQEMNYQLSFKKDIVSMNDLLGYKGSVFVVVDELADSSINILVYCFSKATSLGEYLQTKQEVILEIMKIVEKYHLSFAFPSQSVYIENLPNPIMLENLAKDTR